MDFKAILKLGVIFSSTRPTASGKTHRSVYVCSSQRRMMCADALRSNGYLFPAYALRTDGLPHLALPNASYGYWSHIFRKPNGGNDYSRARVFSWFKSVDLRLEVCTRRLWHDLFCVTYRDPSICATCPGSCSDEPPIILRSGRLISSSCLPYIATPGL